MILTKVTLKPLHKITQLKRLKAYNCVACDYEQNTFTMIFQLDNSGAEEILQDLSIIFDKRIPKVYISEPYTYNNAGSGTSALRGDRNGVL